MCSSYLGWLSAEGLRRGIRLPADPDDTSGSRIPAAIARQLMDRLVEESRDILFGLHMGEHVRPEQIGPMGYAAMSCNTLGEALEFLPDYENFRNELGQCAWHQLDDSRIIGISWRDHADHSGQLRHHTEAAFAAWLTFSRWITGNDQHQPASVHFTFGRPPGSRETEYHRVFGCPVLFDQPENLMVFLKASLDQPLVGQEKPKSSAHRPSTATMPRHDFNRRLHLAIQSMLGSRSLTLEQVASVGEVTPAQLKQALNRHQTRFRDLVDRNRRAQAEKLLCHTYLPPADIASGIGFSGQTALANACHRWFQCTPLEFRQKHTPDEQRINH